MKIFALLPALLFFWPLFKIARKAWRLFAVLCLAAFITGCAGTSNHFDKSPCACDFQNINTGNYEGKIHA